MATWIWIVIAVAVVLVVLGVVWAGMRTRRSQGLQERFGVAYHSNHMWRFLQGLGWSVQKPLKRARERNEKAIAHWKRYTWPHIKKGRTA